MDMATPSIEVNDISVTYPGTRRARVTVVHGLTISVKPGEVVGLIGPNGAGKTSTIKVLMGLIRPAGGTARVCGHPAGTVAARERAGYLPEVALYYPFLTARETLHLYAKLQGIPRKDAPRLVEILLQRVGLDAAIDHRLRTFSKGMLQRVGLAQAIMGDPSVLILDEVTAGLDPVARHDVREILVEFKSRGVAVFFSSHELSEVALLCDRVIMMCHGQKLEERRLEEILADIRRFVVVIKGSWAPRQLPVGVHRRAADNGNAVLVATSELSYGELMKAILDDGKHVERTYQEPGSLEDHFVEKLGHEIT